MARVESATGLGVDSVVGPAKVPQSELLVRERGMEGRFPVSVPLFAFDEGLGLLRIGDRVTAVTAASSSQAAFT